MLNPYHEEIREIAILFAHSGAREERGNRAYAVAAAILRPDGPERKFSSLINYAHFTAMDRSRSNLSRPELATAPEAPEVLKELQTFLGDAHVVLVLPQRDSFLTLKRFCGPRRIVDLGFAAEFFLPGLDSLSLKYLWERLHRRSRPKVSFSAGEGVELAVDLIRHLCRYQLNDRESPWAAALRYYLVKSDTLFGTVFLHCAQRLTDYFGDLISIRRDNDTAAWRPFLPDASKAHRRAVAARIGTEIEALGFPLLVQRRGAPTADLCDEFREIRESVLFGVDSFWYGVDFRGDTLTQVVITRLPLASPVDPLQIARRRTMTAGEYQRRYHYDSAIKMNQGMGRLIRSETDYGRIVILDSRWRNQGASGG